MFIVWSAWPSDGRRDGQVRRSHGPRAKQNLRLAPEKRIRVASCKKDTIVPLEAASSPLVLSCVLPQSPAYHALMAFSAGDSLRPPVIVTLRSGKYLTRSQKNTYFTVFCVFNKASRLTTQHSLNHSYCRHLSRDRQRKVSSCARISTK